MANEITIRLTMSCENGSFKDEFKPASQQVDQSAIGSDSGVQEIGTTEESLSFPNVTTEGLFLIRNLDTTNFVTFGPQVGTGNMEPIGKLLAGQYAMIWLYPGVVIRAKADTAACKVQFLCLER